MSNLRTKDCSTKNLGLILSALHDSVTDVTLVTIVTIEIIVTMICAAHNSVTDVTIVMFGIYVHLVYAIYENVTHGIYFTEVT